MTIDGQTPYRGMGSFHTEEKKNINLSYIHGCPRIGYRELVNCFRAYIPEEAQLVRLKGVQGLVLVPCR